MTEEGFAHHYNTFKDQNLTGATLLELKELLLNPHNITSVFAFFDRLHIDKVGDMLAITAALRRL
jgi:hypothetical protein